MRLRLLSLVAIVAFLAPQQALRAEEPTVIVRVPSVNQLMDNAKYFLTLLGQEEIGKQLDGFLKAQVGANGLEGIDPKKAVAFYGTVGPNGLDSTGILMVPVSDEKAFIRLLDRLNFNVQKGEAGVYTYSIPHSSVDACFRFANGYCYATVLSKTLDKSKLIDPATILPPELSTAVSVSIRMDRIPDGIKQIALSQFELKVQDEQEKKIAKETETQHKFRVAVLKEFARRITQVFKEGQEISLRLHLNRKSNEFLADLSLTGKPGSKLAEEISAVGQAKSLFAGSVGTDSALNSLFHISLPADFQQAASAVFIEGMIHGLKEEKHEARREAYQKLLEVVAPTLKSGDLDVMASLRGPTADKHYALVAGIKLKDGKAVDQALRDMVKTLKDEEQAKIKFNIETLDGIPVHRIDISKKDIDEKSRALFGDSPLFLAIRPDAVVFAYGDQALAALKEVISTKAQVGPALQTEMSIRRLALAMGRKDVDATKFLDEAFALGTENDRVRIALEGGKSLELHFMVKAEVVKFFSLMGAVKNAAGKAPAAE